MDTDIDRVVKRTWRYWYDDGLAEIAGGCLFVAIGLLFLAEALLPPGLLPSLSAIGLPVVAVGGTLLAGRVVRALKMRLTYPRTGYVSYRPAGKSRLLRGMVTGALAGMLAAVFATVHATRAWIPAMQGLAIGAGWLYLAYRVDGARFCGLAVVSGLIGTAAALGNLGDTLGSGVYFAAMGVATAASGAMALRAYFRQTRAPAEVGDYGQ